ncbi:MAG: ATP-dependent RNA helicase [Treponema sp.]|jgi:HrpA-like RNA helicase|nr:ATP-dependent RNA helicase [Treponema sp.]
MNYLELPVYKHKDLILSALAGNQVVVVESPTGSGKTTQLPVILHDAGYGENGIIGVTQPRRIAAVSVSEFIARQMGHVIPGLVGYKMRFEDKTDPHTRIKIMTDGILLQEMKLDPWLSRYCCIVIDEAHERSLNIDFILGLLKRVVETRPEFKIIVSSATINAQVFSQYFGECPIVKIDAITYPVTLIYDPVKVPPAPQLWERTPWENQRARRRALTENAEDALLKKITVIVERVVSEERAGDILIFLSGEKIIKECMERLFNGPTAEYIYVLPLYGRLAREEQERVFDPAPSGKIKVIISTNIAETSVTIDGVTSVIDSGLSKLNHYNPRTFTSSLVEAPISKAAANQRKGRAGRTQEGTCYRLYDRKDFERRDLFTTEEIYRTDLSEVVLRMSDLGLTAFEEFDFISPPNRDGLIAAIETLNHLEALESDRTLSKIGKMMTEFPLPPRQSRIIVEAILKYPDVIIETTIAAAFLSTTSPYVLPSGEEMEARQAHHRFRDEHGDFVSYLKLLRAFEEAPNKAQFCKKNYLDDRTMAEIVNITKQLGEIVSDLGVPLVSGGPIEDYLCCVARGLIQFVCAREESAGWDSDWGTYRTLTEDSILIHPGSVMFRMNPQYIVAGEIVRTSRMYAMSVSPLSKQTLLRISPDLYDGLVRIMQPQEILSTKKTKKKQRANESEELVTPEQTEPKKKKKPQDAVDALANLPIGSEVFEFEKYHKKSGKDKRYLLIPLEKLVKVREQFMVFMKTYEQRYRNLRGILVVRGEYRLLIGKKVTRILSLLPHIEASLPDAPEKQWPRREVFDIKQNLDALLIYLPDLATPTPWREQSKNLGFIGLLSQNWGRYVFNCSRDFSAIVYQSISAMETLIEELGEDVDEETRQRVNQTYRRLTSCLD